MARSGPAPRARRRANCRHSDPRRASRSWRPDRATGRARTGPAGPRDRASSVFSRRVVDAEEVAVAAVALAFLVEEHEVAILERPEPGLPGDRHEAAAA